MIDVYCVNVGTKYTREFDQKLKDSVAKHLAKLGVKASPATSAGRAARHGGGGRGGGATGTWRDTGDGRPRIGRNGGHRARQAGPAVGPEPAWESAPCCLARQLEEPRELGGRKCSNLNIL